VIVRYDDPEFSKRYDVTVADGTPLATARATAAAFAWNREYAPSESPLSKYTATDPHAVRMGELHSRVVG
jgi:hypothetical protein